MFPSLYNSYCIYVSYQYHILLLIILICPVVAHWYIVRLDFVAVRNYASLPRHLLPCTICIFTQTRTYIMTLYIEVCITLVYARLTAYTMVQESIGGYMV